MPPHKKQLGWMADQTLMSWQSTSAAGGRSLFYEVPCGWNRQMSTYWAKRFSSWGQNTHLCQSSCFALHGNGAPSESKRVIESLMADPTGRSCRSLMHSYHCTVSVFRDITKLQPARMLSMVARDCCLH